MLPLEKNIFELCLMKSEIENNILSFHNTDIKLPSGNIMDETTKAGYLLPLLQCIDFTVISVLYQNVCECKNHYNLDQKEIDTIVEYRNQVHHRSIWNSGDLDKNHTKGPIKIGSRDEIYKICEKISEMFDFSDYNIVTAKKCNEYMFYELFHQERVK